MDLNFLPAGAPVLGFLAGELVAVTLLSEKEAVLLDAGVWTREAQDQHSTDCITHTHRLSVEHQAFCITTCAENGKRFMLHPSVYLKVFHFVTYRQSSIIKFQGAEVNMLPLQSCESINTACLYFSFMSLPEYTVSQCIPEDALMSQSNHNMLYRYANKK